MFGAMMRDVDPDLGHRLDREWVEPRRLDPRSGGVEAVASYLPKHSLRHLVRAELPVHRKRTLCFLISRPSLQVDGAA